MGLQDIDGKLTIYALANGMDLVKAEEHRQLEWYRDGRDRGIRIQLTQNGHLAVEVLAWSGDPSTADIQSVPAPRDTQAFLDNLSATLDGAVEAANHL